MIKKNLKNHKSIVFNTFVFIILRNPCPNGSSNKKLQYESMEYIIKNNFLYLMILYIEMRQKKMIQNSSKLKFSFNAFVLVFPYNSYHTGTRK
jgi:hypothetical protein